MIRTRAILLKSDLIGHLRLQWGLTYVGRIIRRIRSEFAFPGSICNLTSQPPVIPSHQHRLVHSAHAAVPGTSHRHLFLILNIGDQHFGS